MHRKVLLDKDNDIPYVFRSGLLDDEEEPIPEFVPAPQPAPVQAVVEEPPDLIECPPTIKSRRFNECDIIGDLGRDEKGNVIVGE